MSGVNQKKDDVLHWSKEIKYLTEEDNDDMVESHI